MVNSTYNEIMNGVTASVSQFKVYARPSVHPTTSEVLFGMKYLEAGISTQCCLTICGNREHSLSLPETISSTDNISSVGLCLFLLSVAVILSRGCVSKRHLTGGLNEGLPTDGDGGTFGL
jgi:hypothetical protein